MLYVFTKNISVATQFLRKFILHYNEKNVFSFICGYHIYLYIYIQFGLSNNKLWVYFRVFFFVCVSIKDL